VGGLERGFENGLRITQQLLLSLAYYVLDPAAAELGGDFAFSAVPIQDTPGPYFPTNQRHTEARVLVLLPPADVGRLTGA
jgi:hypothetical protein